VEIDLAGVVDGHAERLVPGEAHGQIVEAEHLARYHWAATLTGGKRVLDAGCGAAYGSALLAEAGAAEVVGVDIAGPVLASVRPGMPRGVRLEEGDLANLRFEDGFFDLVVCFEVIEHVDDFDGVLDELARVLAEDGALAISSPNRNVSIPGNPHHRHEFVPEELEETLGKRFSEVRLYRQADWIASAVLDDASHGSESTDPLDDIALRKSASGTLGKELYTLALAANGRLPEPPASAVMGSDAEIRELAAGWDELDRQRRELALRTTRAGEKAEQSRRELASLSGQLLRVESELARAYQAAARHADELEEHRSVQVELADQLEDAHRAIHEMQESRIWRIGTSFWRARDRLLGRGAR
jgi:SAM-dependent methyltransferase